MHNIWGYCLNHSVFCSNFPTDFDEIKCFKLETNQQIIALKYQIPSGRSPSLWNEILWKLGEFDIPFESSGVRESCAFLPHGITNEHSNIDSHQDTDNMNQTTAKHITTDFLSQIFIVLGPLALKLKSALIMIWTRSWSKKCAIFKKIASNLH